MNNCIIICSIVLILIILMLFIGLNSKESFSNRTAINKYVNNSSASNQLTNNQLDLHTGSLISAIPSFTLNRQPLGGFTQIIHDLKMYSRYYDFFDIPDADLPKNIIFLNSKFVPDLSEEIIAPVGIRHFIWNNNLRQYTSNFERFKNLPYIAKPIVLNKFPPIPIEQEVIDKLQKLIWFKKVVAKDIERYLILEGHYSSDKIITSKLQGSHFEVTKNVTWLVKLKAEYIYKPLKIGGISDYLTNEHMAKVLHYKDPVIDPKGVFSYYFSTDMTLSTSNSYIRKISDEPPTSVDPFDPQLEEISLKGKPVDIFGNYSIVGHTTNNDYFNPKFFGATLPSPTKNIIIQTDLTNKPVDFAFQENGTLIRL